MSVAQLPATTAPQAPARANGWWGMAIFAAAEAALVATIVGSYFYLWANTAQWPPVGTPEPKALLPVLLTVGLMLALVPFRLALGAARAGERGEAVAFLAGATLLQGVYLGIELHLFLANLQLFTPQQSAYASIYYVLLGAAHAHVAVGLLLDVWLLARLSSRLTPYRLVAIEAITLYWYVVAALATVVLLTELAPRL